MREQEMMMERGMMEGGKGMAMDGKGMPMDASM
jgi:hypothetical protein